MCRQCKERTVTNKYTKAEQRQWVHTRSDWETKRRDEFVPSVAISVGVVLFVVAGFKFLNVVKMWEGAL